MRYSADCYDKLLSIFIEEGGGPGVETRASCTPSPSGLKCLVCSSSTYSDRKPYRETCQVGHTFLMKENVMPCARHNVLLHQRHASYLVHCNMPLTCSPVPCAGASYHRCPTRAAS